MFTDKEMDTMLDELADEFKAYDQRYDRKSISQSAIWHLHSQRVKNKGARSAFIYTESDTWIFANENEKDAIKVEGWTPDGDHLIECLRPATFEEILLLDCLFFVTCKHDTEAIGMLVDYTEIIDKEEVEKANIEFNRIGLDDILGSYNPTARKFTQAAVVATPKYALI